MLPGIACWLVVTILYGRVSGREREWLVVTAREAVVYEGLYRGDRGWRLGRGLVVENLGKHDEHDWYRVGLRNGLRGWMQGWVLREILPESIGDEFKKTTPRVERRPFPVAVIADQAWLRTEPEPRGSGLVDQTRFLRLEEGDRAMAVESEDHWVRLDLGGGIYGWVFDEFLVAVKTLPERSILNGMDLTNGVHPVLFLRFAEAFPAALTEVSWDGGMLEMSFLRAGLGDVLKTPDIPEDSPLAALEVHSEGELLKLTVKMRKPLTGYYRVRIGDKLAVIMRFLSQVNPDRPLKGLRICLDPGHGDITFGLADGAKNEKYEIWERDEVLKIAGELENLLVEEGAEVVLTRRVNDSSMNDLSRRIEVGIDFAADVYLSLHLNGGPDYRFGSETYFYDRPSMPLAWFVLDGVSEKLGTRFNYSTYASFAVLRESRFPGTLIEFLYLSREEEALQATGEDFARQAAEGVRDGLVKYVLACSSADLTKENTIPEGYYPFWNGGNDD